jgi:AcrR family transcriptional regulator
VPLSRQDWVDAAWEAMRTGGLEQVAVNALAKGLGTARSSFYWHFQDRSELVLAALGEWERRLTDDMIAAARLEPDPRERLRRLLATVFAEPTVAGVEVALAAYSDDPVVGPILARITAKRIDFVAQCFADLGFGVASRARALVAYSAFVGWLQVQRTAPEVAVLSPEDGTDLVAVIEGLFVPPA